LKFFSCEKSCVKEKNCCSDYSICEEIENLKIDQNQNKTILNNSISDCLFASKDGKNCLQCQDGLFYYKNQCLVFCPKDTEKFMDNQICIDKNCTKEDCLTCDQNGICKKCFKGFYLYKGDCIDKCPLGLYADRKTWTCQNNLGTSLYYVMPSKNSCKNYCGKNFTSSASNLDCSCESSCFQKGNCCEDFSKECSTKINKLSSKNIEKSLIKPNLFGNKTEEFNLTYSKLNSTKLQNKNNTQKTKLTSNYNSTNVMQNHNQSINVYNFTKQSENKYKYNDEKYEINQKPKMNFTKNIFQDLINDSFVQSIFNSVNLNLKKNNELLKEQHEVVEEAINSEGQLLQSFKSNSNKTKNNLKIPGPVSLTIINGNQDVKIVNQNIKNVNSFNTIHLNTEPKM
jgi:hypothetical protein